MPKSAHLVTLAALAAASSLTLPAQTPERELELIPSGPVTVDERTGEVIATGGAQIVYDLWLLSAETIRYNQRTGQATATGNVIFTREDLRVVADSLVYMPEEEFARVENFRAGNGRVYVDGSLLEGNPDNFRFTDVNFYPGEPGTFLFVAKAGEVALIDRKEVRGKRLFFKVGPIPFLLIPNITQPLDAETNLFKPKLDYSGHIGASIGAEILAPVASNYRAGGNIALTSKRGILLGPSARYSAGDESSSIRGSFISGYINDQGDLGVDLLGDPIDKHRYFGEWSHQQQWDDYRMTIAAHARLWSDSEMTRDFHEDSFDEMQDPDSYLEANYNDQNWQLSLFARSALNDFQFHAERLPELRFSYFPTRITGGLSHSGSITASRLRSDASAFHMDGGSTRLDAFYGLDYHKALREGINFRFKAGARAIRYDDADLVIGYSTLDDGVTPDFQSPIVTKLDAERALGEIGMDLDLKAYSIFEYKNDTWNIDGIRHILQPRLSYRYTPDLKMGSSSFIPTAVGPDGSLSEIRRFRGLLDYDRAAFGNFLAPIDIEDRLDVDSLAEDHRLRFEVRNRWQTRAESGGSRNLARLDLATDYYLKGSTYGDEQFSRLHGDLALTPAPWLELGLFARFDPENSFETSEINTRITLQDLGYWRLEFGSHFLREDTLFGNELTGWPGIGPSWPISASPYPLIPIAGERLEQYYASLEYFLSENFKIYASTRYDDASGVFYEQRIGLMQRALERYGLRYEIRFYDGDRREDSFSLSVGIALFD